MKSLEKQPAHRAGEYLTGLAIGPDIDTSVMFNRQVGKEGTQSLRPHSNRTNAFGAQMRRESITSTSHSVSASRVI